jgi:hypothetical protein
MMQELHGLGSKNTIDEQALILKALEQLSEMLQMLLVGSGGHTHVVQVP